MTLDDYRKLSAEERAVADKATPGPWFNAYRRVQSEPAIKRYSAEEALIPDDAGDEDPRWDALPEVDVCAVPASHGDTPTAQGQRDAAHIARSRTAVPALCDAVDALLSVIDALPKCLCGKTATRELASARRLSIWCDGCAEARAIYDPYDLPYAPALRAMFAKAPG